jgi:hypothetical protein
MMFDGRFAMHRKNLLNRNQFAAYGNCLFLWRLFNDYRKDDEGVLQVSRSLRRSILMMPRTDEWTALSTLLHFDVELKSSEAHLRLMNDDPVFSMSFAADIQTK